MAHHHGAILMVGFRVQGCEGVHREPSCYIGHRAKIENEMETGVN